MEGKAIDSGGKKDNPPRINRAQDTYLSNCRKKDKAREERKRIEKEQAYTSMLVLGMIGIRWKKTTKRNGSKNRLDWTGKESKRLKNVPQNGRRFDRCPPLAFHPVQCASERAVWNATHSSSEIFECRV